MDLSIQDVAAILKLSSRQVRNLVKDGKIEARKVGGQWMIPEEKLPQTDRQRQQNAAKAGELKETVAAALSSYTRPRYTLRSLHAFSQASTCFQDAKQLLGDHAAVNSLMACCLALSRGAHAFRDRVKAQSYAEARDHAADATALLYLHGCEEGTRIAERLEGEVLQALGGLLRNLERKERL